MCCGDAKTPTAHRVRSLLGTLAGSGSIRSGPADINLLARGASNAKWHSGCLAPDRCVESICDWLIRGPLFCAAQCRGADILVCHLRALLRAANMNICPTTV